MRLFVLCSFSIRCLLSTCYIPGDRNTLKIRYFASLKELLLEGKTSNAATADPVGFKL